MRLNKPALRIMSTAAFLAIISSCAMPAFAGTYYLEDGDISVKHENGEDYVSQTKSDGSYATGKDKHGNDFTIDGSRSEKDIHGEDDKEVTISNNREHDTSTSTKNTITIDNKDSADKSKAIKEIWSDEATGAEGTRKSDDTSAKVSLKDVNIEAEGGAGITVKGTGDVTIILDGDNNPHENGGRPNNKVSGDAGHAGIEKNDKETPDDENGSSGALVIRQKKNTDRNLEADGGAGAAGIGSAEGKDTSNIAIINCGVTAKGGDAKDATSDGGAGIGSGAGGNASDITVKNGRFGDTGNEQNSIKGGSGVNGGAGIGSGGSGNADKIFIDNGTYDITGGDGTTNGGAGIGSGGNGNAGISPDGSNDNDIVIANGTFDRVEGGAGGLNGGAGIGGGGGTGDSKVRFDNGTVRGTITGGEGGTGSGGAGIGGGGGNYTSDVSVNGGTFNNGSSITGGNGGQNGGAGIGGGGANGTSKADIKGGAIRSEVKGGDGSQNGGAGIGGGGSNNSSTVDITLGTDSFITNAKGGNGGAGIGGGSGNTTSDVTINMEIKSDTVLAGHKNGYISGAQGGNGGAGIGGGANNTNSTVTVKNGIIESSKGGDNGAGIGTGANSKNGTVTIEKGNITAEGGKHGAGIGGGLNGDGNGSVSITGGTVKATGGDNAYAIGSSKNNGGSHDVTINTSTDRTKVTAIARTNSQKAGDVIEGAATGTGTAVSYENLLETNSGVIYFKTLTADNIPHHFQTIHNKAFTLEGIPDAEDIHPWEEVERVEPTYDKEGYIKYICKVDDCLEVHTVPLAKLQRPDSGKDDDRPTTPTNPSNPTKPGNYDTPASDPTVDSQPQQPGTLPSDDIVPQQPGTLPEGGTTADTTGTTDAAADAPAASTTGMATADTTAADITAQEGGAAAAQTGATAHTASVPGALPQTGQNWLGALAAAFGGFGLLGFGLLSDKKRHFRSR